MPDMLSPGVYISEADFSDYVSSSSTCIIGMVGGARRGPMNIPTLVTTQRQLVEIFGNPIEGDYGIYCALEALTKASQVYYTRVVRGGVKASAGILGTDKILYYAKDFGTASNGIKVEQIVHDDTLVDIIVKSAAGEELESFVNCTYADSTKDTYVDTKVNANSEHITAYVQYSGSVKAKNFELSGGAGSGSYSRAGQEGVNKITFRSKYYDSDLNSCTVVISAADLFGYFSIAVKKGEELIESWESLQIDPESDRFIEKVVNKGSSRIVCSVSPSTSVQFAEETLMFSGGDDGVHGISASDIIGEEIGSGLYSFSNDEAIDVDLLAAPGWSDEKVINAGTSICEDRGDCFYIIDPPFGLSAQEVLNWSNGTGAFLNKALDSSYNAVYWPWVKIPDTFTKKDIWLPPSGSILAQYAYSDSVSYPWKAPAGLERGHLTRPTAIEVSPTKGERDALYGNRNVVNSIANLLTNGLVIWGQKTTQRKPTALDRVNVRRLMNYVKKSVRNSMRYFVFESNDEATWERARNIIDSKLLEIKSQGGVYDYKILIQPSASEVENNVMPVSIYVKPMKAAEFIPVTFNIMNYSASFDNM